jgi:Zn-dependent peptidase ImmA (M78 family)/transcriptional regulator with XRE-family HTH domain
VCLPFDGGSFKEGKEMRYEPALGIQPDVLRWARQTIGLSIDDVAERLNRHPNEIANWETGESAPTYPQLEKLAYQVYKRPLAVFFLPTPPEEIVPASEFRTLPDTDLKELTPDTHLQIRHAHAYKLALHEVFESKNPSNSCIWEHIHLSRLSPISTQAQTIRDHLGISLRDQMKWKDDDFALKQWRQAVENVGIFVFKSSFKQKDISGFCLYDNVMPVIYLNNSTTKTRQIFSLFHELAHLLFGMNGISKLNSDYINYLPQTEKIVEQFCNAITAELLIPLSDFSQQTSQLNGNIEQLPEEIFSALASRYSVSREAILRRFLDLNRVSSGFYEKKAKEWLAQKKGGKSGGDWYSTHNTYLSNRFATEVIGRHYRNQLSIERASDLLGINPKNFAGLEQRILQGAGV